MIKNIKRRILPLIPVGIGFLWFFILQLVMTSPRYILYVRLDDYIPFVPIFIVPYVLWYFYMAAPFLLLFRRDYREYLRYCKAIAATLIVTCFIYSVWTNGINLRPDLTGRAGIFTEVIRVLYEVDSPMNSAPSLHTSLGVIAHMGFVRYLGRGRRTRFARAISLIYCILNAASTVLIKQHSIIDTAGGLLLALIICALWAVSTPRVRGTKILRTY